MKVRIVGCSEVRRENILVAAAVGVECMEADGGTDESAEEGDPVCDEEI